MRLVFSILAIGAMGGLLSAAHAQTAPSNRPSTWTDPQTGLIWTSSDNGAGLTASQAAYYCRTLTLDGHKDWSLPTIDELHRLFGGPPTASGYHITAPINLTGWQWSASGGQQRGEQWALDFGDGARASVVAGDSGLNRALCVRRPKK
jgi:Protein of unknown function (DUF1566)